LKIEQYIKSISTKGILNEGRGNASPLGVVLVSTSVLQHASQTMWALGGGNNHTVINIQLGGNIFVLLI